MYAFLLKNVLQSVIDGNYLSLEIDVWFLYDPQSNSLNRKENNREKNTYQYTFVYTF